MDFQSVGLTKKEFDSIINILGHNPNDLELALIAVMWSEHCSYKSSRNLLKNFPQKGKQVVLGPGENAGVVNLGNDWGLAFKVESHNHPSALDPFNGAGTGVGGVLRDILAMGAKPSMAMAGLFLGDLEIEKNKWLSKGIRDGINDYSDKVGVSVIGGKTFYSSCYNENPLVNAFGAGFVKLSQLTSSKTAQAGDLVFILGAKTNLDGVAGAAFASKELENTPPPRIPKGNPELEKLLINCCLDLLEEKSIASMQDMGAAGILSSSSEIAYNSGTGIKIYCEKIPLEQEVLTAREIFLSETQERMLLVVKKENINLVTKKAQEYNLSCQMIGEITTGDRYQVLENNQQLVNLPVSILAEAPLKNWSSQAPIDALKKADIKYIGLSDDPLADITLLLEMPHSGDKSVFWEDDKTASNNFLSPGQEISAIKLPESERAVVLAMETEPWKCQTQPFNGASETMALSLRKLWLAGATELGMTNCLNFPSPEKKENYHALSECINGLAAVCRDLECPVVSGNVSLYNETLTNSIYPSPLVVTVGITAKLSQLLLAKKSQKDDLIFLVGPLCGSLGASRWQHLKFGAPQGSTVNYQGKLEKLFKEKALKTANLKKANSGRVIAGGGLALALSLEFIYSEHNKGFEINLPQKELTEILFSEGGPRAIYFVAQKDETDFKNIWHDFPTELLGSVSGDDLSFTNLGSLSKLSLIKARNKTKLI